jgi:hypothetical protein
MIYPGSFKVLALTFGSLIHFEVICMQGERKGSSFNLQLIDNPIFPTPFVEESIFSNVCFWQK